MGFLTLYRHLSDGKISWIWGESEQQKQVTDDLQAGRRQGRVVSPLTGLPGPSPLTLNPGVKRQWPLTSHQICQEPGTGRVPLPEDKPKVCSGLETQLSYAGSGVRTKDTASREVF